MLDEDLAEMPIRTHTTALALVSLAALVLNTTAHAQSVHVMDEASGLPCLSVIPVPINEIGDGGDEATGGCPVQLEGEATLSTQRTQSTRGLDISEHHVGDATARLEADSEE